MGGTEAEVFRALGGRGAGDLNRWASRGRRPEEGGERAGTPASMEAEGERGEELRPEGQRVGRGAGEAPARSRPGPALTRPPAGGCAP